MKMQHKKYNMLAVAVSSLFITSNAFAKPPTAYDNWSITGGVVDTSVSCADANITCRVLVEDDGFMYEEVTRTDVNKIYHRLIVTDEPDGTPADLTFASESFIPFAIVDVGIDQGVAVKQYVRDPSDPTFEDVAEIQKAFLRLDPTFVPTFGQTSGTSGGDPTPVDESFTTKLKQTFGTGTDLESNFEYLNFTQFKVGQATSTPDTDEVIGQKVTVSQTALIGNPGDTNTKQAFEFRQANGIKGTDATGSGFDANYHFGQALSLAGSMTVETYDNLYDGSTVSYLPQNDIAVTWVAQSDNVDFSGSGGGGSGATGAGFAYQLVENRTNGTSGQERYLNFIDGDRATIDPFDWDVNNFGAEPLPF